MLQLLFSSNTVRFILPLLIFLGCSQTIEQHRPSLDPELELLLQVEMKKHQLQASAAADSFDLADYHQQLATATPDATPALKANLLAEHNQKFFVIDQDILLPRGSFQGGVNIWTLNQKAIERDDAEIEQQLRLLSARLTGDDRGVYYNNIARWPVENDVFKVYYRFEGNFSDWQKLEAQRAMTDWQDAAGGVINFQESAELAQLTLKIVQSSEEYLGLATVGYTTDAYLNINIDQIKAVSKDDSKKALYNPSGKVDENTIFYATVLHELGHVLGLLHEHQRWDRDLYVTPLQNDQIGKKIPWKYFSHSWKNESYGKITIAIPVATSSKQYSCTTSVYDYRSIMHYNTFRAIQQQQNYYYGWPISFNTVLSVYDKKIIKDLYRDGGGSC